MGGEMLARGQLQDSLSHYHAAVEGDPSNYLTYFKRGTVYLALAKAKLAVVDFNKVLELKPDFTGARMQRAFILLKQGNLEEARDDFYYVYCPWSPRLRELRSKCYIELNDSFSAILDLKSATKLQSDNTKGYYDLSILHYQIGQPHESLREVRECLKLDPDHKLCFPHYKKVKNVEKFTTSAQTAEEGKDYDTCVKSANKILKTEKEEPMIKFLAYERLCRCYLHLDEITQSLNACEEALRINKSPDVLCDRAEAYINSEMYDDAIRDYQDVLEMTDNYDRAKEGLQRAQKLQKQAEKRDYYKILGVKRTASKKEIIKAYRRAAQQWHPDNFPEGDEKKKAEKKFIDIAAAKEVLTDPEKRQKFDRGEDPLDPESGQHEHFNNFQHFNAFQGGSPFTFRFHFN
ncbi:hypothetical protein AAG570_010282 [Ranatra chinensis]|uniref:J domain-containing protein n=1 Tax=Ranatra chinensis TaxID=642074 RepID=A0ABD0YM39_9HEMI